MHFDCRLALELQTKFEKECSSSLEVVDNDADVVHPLDRHVIERRVETRFVVTLRVVAVPPARTDLTSRRKRVAAKAVFRGMDLYEQLDPAAAR